jgi:hypothetical protein
MIPVLFRGCGDSAVALDTGVVDEDFDGAENILDASKGGSDIIEA